MTDQDDFREGLLRRIEGYKATEDKLQARSDEIASELQAVRGHREAAEALYAAEFGGVRAVEPPPIARTRKFDGAAAPDADFSAGPYTGLPWEVAIRRVLAVDSPLHVKEIWDRLVAGRFRTQAQDPVRSIVAVASRSRKLVKAGPNTYALVEGKTSAVGAGKE